MPIRDIRIDNSLAIHWQNNTQTSTGLIGHLSDLATPLTWGTSLSMYNSQNTWLFYPLQSLFTCLQQDIMSNILGHTAISPWIVYKFSDAPSILQADGHRWPTLDWHLEVVRGVGEPGCRSPLMSEHLWCQWFGQQAWAVLHLLFHTEKFFPCLWEHRWCIHCMGQLSNSCSHHYIVYQPWHTTCTTLNEVQYAALPPRKVLVSDT